MKRIFLTTVLLPLATCGVSCKTEVSSVDALTAPIDPAVTLFPPGTEWSNSRAGASAQETEKRFQE